MKTLKTVLFGFGISAMLWSCDTKEKAQLHHKIDSLNTELQASKKVEDNMRQVDALIDSIDLHRMALNTKMVEGTSYADYVTRMKDINNYLQDTQKKIGEMEKSAKTANKVASANIQRLKNDLALRAKEIVSLQLEIANLRDDNKSMASTITRKDSLISLKDQIIKVKESDIATLEDQQKQTFEQNKTKVADLYFAQAQALETAAQRTKFAPRKKKETRREALELYKLSLSMGKTEAQDRIDKLEKELS